MNAKELLEISMGKKDNRSLIRIRSINALARAGFLKKGITWQYRNYYENEIDIEKVYNAIVNGKIFPGFIHNVGKLGIKEICEWVSAEHRVHPTAAGGSDSEQNMKMNLHRAQELIEPLRNGTANGISEHWQARLIEALEYVIEHESQPTQRAPDVLRSGHCEHVPDGQYCPYCKEA